ncbi:MAG: hypothetical protein LCH63_14570 [Candidatus Melainabacteria bacterium]|nr:hypothetical protein [Candidatus Melainabacteria bacterium]
MKLTDSQVQRFYGIWFPLLRFVNKKRNVIAQAKLLKDSVDPADVALVREVLWSDSRLLDDFIKSNPESLSAEDLSVVDSWRFRVSGEYFVLKHLKKHSIFISSRSSDADDDEPIVYAVVGIHSPLAELIDPLPSLIRTTLIPFEGKITYDSLFVSFPVRFGRNIAGSLNEDYQRVKKQGALIETLQGPSLKVVR